MAWAGNTEPLDANEEWVGNAMITNLADHITGLVYSDVAGTLHIEQSGDGTNWDLDETVAVAADTGVSFKKDLVAPQVRIRYVNGPAAQSEFRISARFSSAGTR